MRPDDYKVGSVEIIRDSGTTYRGVLQLPNGKQFILEAGPELATKAEACQAADNALREVFWKRGSPIIGNRPFNTMTAN